MKPPGGDEEFFIVTLFQGQKVQFAGEDSGWAEMISPTPISTYDSANIVTFQKLLDYEK